VRLYLDDGKSERFLDVLVERFENVKLGDITGISVRKAAKDLYPKAAGSTLNRQVITPMRAVIRHAADAGMCQPLSVKRFPEERVTRPAGDKEWLKIFCRTAMEMNMPETAAIARFMFETATRVSEACRLEWKDVDIGEGRAFLTRTKTVPRTVFLTRGTANLLRGIPHNGPVFSAANRSTVQKRFDRVIQAAGLPRLTSHEIGRHGFATEMIVRQGVDIATTAEHGGWKSTRLMMDRYVKGDDKRTVIDRVFGEKKK
jgi:integrase